jgi:putative membrane protein
MKPVMIALGLALLSMPSWAADNAKTEGAATAAKMSANDFAEQASVAGMFEIESSKLALQKSKNQKVREFAQKMVTDHQKADTKLKQVHPKGIATGLDEEHSKTMDRLRAADADTFDKAYIAEQTTAHQQAVELFGGYAAGGDDPKLKAFAQETLPTLKQHLAHVKTLN